MTDRPTWLLVALVALAGCSGLSAPTPTVTPAPVPGDGVDYPPGVDDRGVYSPAELASAHDAALAPASYTRVETLTARTANGTPWATRTVRTRVAPDGRRHTVAELGGPEATYPSPFRDAMRVEVYVENGIVYFAGWNETADYASFERAGGGVSVDRLRLLLSAFETRAEPVRRNGTTLVRVESTRLADPYYLESAERAVRGDVRDGEFRALVTPDGLVREYRVVVTVAVDGTLVRVERDVGFRAVGETTVERPAWYDDAVAAAGED